MKAFVRTVSVSAFVLLLGSWGGLMSLLMASPGVGLQHAPGTRHKHHQHRPAVAAPVKPLPVKSLYQLQSKWMNQDGRTIKFSSLKGKIRVISMIYASCPHACPMTISDLKRIESGIPAKYRDRVGFVLVTFDPVRDTAKKLKALATKRQLNLKRWTLVRGADGDVLELAAVLGVKFKKVSAEDYAHSNLISILTPLGVLKHQQVGLNQDPAQTIKILRQMLGIPPSSKPKKRKTT